VTIDEAKALMLAACDDADKSHPGEGPPGFREAIAALPNRDLLRALDPAVRQRVELQLKNLLHEDVRRSRGSIPPRVLSLRSGSRRRAHD
jgi:hypothetical protein